MILNVSIEWSDRRGSQQKDGSVLGKGSVTYWMLCQWRFWCFTHPVPQILPTCVYTHCIRSESCSDFQRSFVSSLEQVKLPSSKARFRAKLRFILPAAGERKIVLKAGLAFVSSESISREHHACCPGGAVADYWFFLHRHTPPTCQRQFISWAI